MLCLVFGKRSRTQDPIIIPGVESYYVYVNKQVSLLAATATTAEISGLRQSLGRGEEELSLVKWHLEENKGK